MKGLLLILVLGSVLELSAQGVLNGSFENNSFVSGDDYYCNFNNDCHNYRQKMADSNAWNAVPNWDGDYHDCFIGAIIEGCTYQQTPWGPKAQDGDWSIILYGFRLESFHKANAISLALSSPLEVGTTYSLSYYVKKPPNFNSPGISPHHSATLIVGISEKDTALGELIHTSAMPDSLWRLQSISFEASQPADYLSFKINTPSPQTDVLLRYVAMLDHVVLSGGAGVPSSVLTKQLSVYPNPTTGYVRIESAGSSLAVYDLLGKEHYRSEMHDTHNLFIQDWSQGVYVVKTYDSQGKLVGAQKLIKNK